MSNASESPPPSPPRGAAATRRALIAAGIRLFGRQGFSATTTRQLASEAGVNIAAIAYHFGSKEGLRRACAEAVADRLGEVARAAGSALPDDPARAARQIEAALRAFAGFLLAGDEARDILPFMLRELTEGGPAVDLVHDRVFAALHEHMCALWARATGQPAGSDHVRLAVFALAGQALYFRIGARIVTRRMGWNAIGPAEAAAITERLVANLHAALKADREAANA